MEFDGGYGRCPTPRIMTPHIFRQLLAQFILAQFQQTINRLTKHIAQSAYPHLYVCSFQIHNLINAISPGKSE
ncbi:MAG TPA: hypothetical protein PLD25_06865 [Chloroflexota bacterium]|nr:hypothetical protein [Chloroflexota bacterium]